MNLKKPIYSLVEAAELLGCSPDDFIRQGADGRLSLYVRTPDNLELFNVGSVDLQGSKPYERYTRHEPTRAINVNYLRLRPADCQQLLRAGMCLVGKFKAGGTLDGNGNLQCTTPPCPRYGPEDVANYSGLDHINRSFATYRRGTLPSDYTALTQPRVVEITSDALLLDRSEILALRKQKLDAPDELLGQVVLEVQPHTSSKLRQLVELHNLIWGRAHRPDFKHPTRDYIEARLIQEYAFSKNQAECGALFLTSTTLETDAKTGKPRLDASMLKGLIRCSDKQWSAPESSSLPRPTADVIEESLTKLGLPAHRAPAAASIIRPDNAPTGRRPSPLV